MDLGKSLNVLSLIRASWEENCLKIIRMSWTSIRNSKVIDLTLLFSIHQQLINMKKWALILNKSLYHILSDLNFDHKEEFLFELINLNGFILYKFTNFPLIPFWEIFLSCCLFCWELIDFYGQITGNDESAVISYSMTRTIAIKTQK